MVLINNFKDDLDDAAYAVKLHVVLPEKVRSMVNDAFVKYGLTCPNFTIMNMIVTPLQSTPLGKSRNCSLNLAHAADFITKMNITAQQQQRHQHGHVQQP